MNENICIICDSKERNKIEDGFFSGERSEVLIAQDLNTNGSAVIYHMQTHTHRGQIITDLVTKRDDQIKAYLEDISRLETSEILDSITRTYRELSLMAGDLQTEYWNLREDDQDSETLKARLAIFQTVDKALQSFSKSIPEDVFSQKKTGLREAILDSRKLIDKIRNEKS